MYLTVLDDRRPGSAEVALAQKGKTFREWRRIRGQGSREDFNASRFIVAPEV